MRGLPINKNWRFSLNNPEGAHLTETPDDEWENVSLPHDWSIELPYDRENGEACTGYLQGGLGWYRKHFITTQEMSENRIILNFDGIYNRASIYCNGQLVKFHPYGYSPCLVDVTDYLNPVGKDNCVAVRVDHTRYADSRWYSGSGIYRKVSMHILPQIHIPVWGTFFSTPKVTKKEAKIQGLIKVKNDTCYEKKVCLSALLKDPYGCDVLNVSRMCTLYPKEEAEVDFNWIISEPILWEIHDGKTYEVQLRLQDKDDILQEETVKIGIRTFEFNNTTGFEFNGRKQLIKGVCLHHDGGAVGAAVPLDVWKRRLEKLKECGCNAIRTAHNPASEDFLDLCDEMGFLVQEEFYDEWDYPKGKQTNATEKQEYVNYISRGHAEFFGEYAKSDLQNVILRDRNHPCIFQWSIGNEIEWTYPKYNAATGYFSANASGNYFWTLPPYSIEKIRDNISKLPPDCYEIGKTAHKLSKWTKELDKTRPVVANCILPSASYESGYIDALDVVGYSYRRVIYEYGHTNYPEKPILGTENVGQWHEWKAVLDKEYIPGIFLWTGVDYIGESKSAFPIKGGKRGLLNYAGFAMPSYHMFKSLWNKEPHIHCETQELEKSLYQMDQDGRLVEKIKDGWKRRLWQWQDVNPYWCYEEGQLIVVEAYTNCEEAELFVNENSLGVRKMEDCEDHILKWVVPYQPGEIKVVGKSHGKVMAKDCLRTPEKFRKLLIKTDKNVIDTSVDSIAHVVVELADQYGNPIRHTEEEIEFSVGQPGLIAGIDNGANDNVAFSKGNQIKTYRGKALLMVKGQRTGNITVTAQSRKIISENLNICVKEGKR